MANTRLTRTLSGTLSNTWTWSAWVKRQQHTDGQYHYLFGFESGGGNYQGLAIGSSGDTYPDILYYYTPASGQQSNQSRKIYDTSGYAHVVCRCNNNSIDVWVNGVQHLSAKTGQTADANADMWIGSGQTNWFLEGNISDVVFVEGQALSYGTFAEQASDESWNPKTPAEIRSAVGNFGTNGYFLTFEDSANPAHDYQTSDRSGTTNDFTPSGSGQWSRSGADNKFATLDYQYSQRNSLVYEFNNLTASSTSTNHTIVRGTHGIKSGKWYWEAQVVGSNPRTIGICDEVQAYTGQYLGQDTHSIGMYWDSSTMNFAYGGSTVATATQSQSSGTTVMIAYDHDAGKFWMGVNGTWVNSGDPANGTNPQATWSLPANVSNVVFPAFSAWGTSQTWFMNFGDPSYSITSGNADENGYGHFEYEPPAGFLSLCDANMAPTHRLIDNVRDYVHVDSYSGNGTINRQVTTGFPTDFAAVKGLTGTDTGYFWRMSDRTLLSQQSNTYVSTGANNEFQNGVNDYIAGFNSTGFTVTQNSIGGANESGSTYEYFALRAGGTVETTTDGNGATIYRSANSTAGFSCIYYSGNGVQRTIPHGLGKKPSVVLIKGDQVSDWRMYHIGNAGTDAERLMIPNDNSPVRSLGHGYLRSTQPTDTTVTLPETSYNGHSSAWESNTNGNGYIMWCFADIPGFSAFGQYRGDGAKVHVYTGFRPAYTIIVPFTNSSVTTGMRSFSDVRITQATGDNQDALYWSTNAAVANQNGMDYKSNGFTLEGAGDQNANNAGTYYLYLAWARSPFMANKTSGANAFW